MIGFSNDMNNTLEIGKNLFYNFPFLLEIKVDYLNNILRYNADSNSGHSGSCLYYYDHNSKEYVIIGLHLGKIKHNFPSIIEIPKDKSNSKNSKPNRINISQDLNLGLYFDEKFFKQITEWLENYNISMNNLPVYKKLNLGWKSLKDEDLEYLPNLNTLCIKELFLNQNNFTDQTLNIIFKLKFDNLNYLNLQANNFTFSIFKEIKDKINLSKINNLLLSNNQISDEGFLLILKTFIFGKLIILDFANNFIVGEILKDFQEIIEFPYLEKLDISSNRINVAGKALLESKIIVDKGVLIFSHGIKSPKKTPKKII